MDFIEKKEQQFRNEIFKDHVAYQVSAGPAQIIEWKQPGTALYGVTYVLYEDSLMVKGDMGEAIYREDGGEMSLLELSRMKLGSFTKRLRGFCDDRWDYDPETAKSELEEYGYFFREDESEEALDAIREVMDEYGSFEGYRYGLGQILVDYELEGEDIAILFNLGRRMPGRLIAYWVGLQMAVEQLKIANAS